MGSQDTRRVPDRHVPLFIMDNTLRRLFSPPEKILSQYLSKGMTVADLGCGPGYFTLQAAEIVGPEGKVYAVDSDARAIRTLESKAVKQVYTNIDFRVGTASNLNFIPDKSVNFVLANGMLCCMCEHLGAVEEIERILKSDGVAHLSISKFGRRKDPGHVTKEEWQRILDDFDVASQGESWMTRWASCRTNPHRIGEQE